MLIKIKQGDADTLTETITGLASLAGYTAELYISSMAGTILRTIVGSISTLTITYQIVNETTKALDVGRYRFETKIWDASDHVYTPSSGTLIITDSIEEDPS